MKFKSLFAKNKKAEQAVMPETSFNMQSPSQADVNRYQFHYGANLGSTFILERWLTPCMFHESAKGSSELAAVESWVKVESLEKARERFERHWREYVSDADLDWLKDKSKCTTVRLPIGFFTLGPQYCEHTAFQGCVFCVSKCLASRQGAGEEVPWAWYRSAHRLAWSAWWCECTGSFWNGCRQSQAMELACQS